MNCEQALALPEHERVIELNRSCYCLPLDRTLIDASITRRSGVRELSDLLTARANLFAGTPVFLAEGDVSAMLAQITAIEALTTLDTFRRDILARSKPTGADIQGKTFGAFMGYDFHITPDGPRLIEINTNAGGAFLVNAMHKALDGKLPKCSEYRRNKIEDFESQIIAMFLNEWKLAGRSERPRTLAIVDDDPPNQFLYPEMLLAQELFTRHGIETYIFDPSELSNRNGELHAGNVPIDMVYNRLTDFALSSPVNTELRRAYLADRCVVTPAPRHHSLFADKRNLVLLSDRAQLATWGLEKKHVDALDDSLKTIAVTAEMADSLWTQRKQFFFKPAAGFGSRAVYRGSKLTRRVWAEIVAGDYVAQAYTAPTQRALSLASGPAAHKFDVRVYTYAGQMLLMAARIYQGQTTNFRTRGGGFAPIIVSG